MKKIQLLFPSSKNLTINLTLRQEGIRTKSSVHEFDNNSSKGYPEGELADDYYMDDFCSDATKKKIKKSVDRV